ncbi:hypothetical protein ACFL0M_10480 [Thermodesulfobacteriota bacterium]
MIENGEAQKDAIRPDFNRSIFIDFSGAKITSDVGLLLMREVDQRFGITASGLRKAAILPRFPNTDNFPKGLGPRAVKAVHA